MRKLILILLAIVLLATNPNKENYIDYTKQNILGHNASGLDVVGFVWIGGQKNYGQ